MSDWRLTNKEGSLVWTSPALPGGGTALHTTLSPTLILGSTKKGDTLPQNFIKLPDVTRVSMPQPTHIQLDRRTGTSILLVCNDGPQEAATWLQAIQRAVGGGGSLKPGGKPSTPATPTASNTPAGVVDTPAEGSASSVGGASAAATPTAGSALGGRGPTTTTNPQMAGIANALRTDLQARPIADPTAAPTTPRRDDGSASSFANAASAAPASQQGGGVGSNNLSTSASGSITAPAPGTGVTLPVVSASGSGSGGTPQVMMSASGGGGNSATMLNDGDRSQSGSVSPGPTSPNSQFAPADQMQMQPQGARPATLASSNSGNFGGGGNFSNNATSQLLGRSTPVGAADTNNRTILPGQLNPTQLQQPQQQSSNSQTPAGSNTPLAGGAANSNIRPAAVGASAVAVGGGGLGLGLQNQVPIATATTQKTQFEIVQPGTGGGTIRPVVAPMLGTGGGWQSSTPGNNVNVNATNNAMSTPGGWAASSLGAGSMTSNNMLNRTPVAAGASPALSSMNAGNLNSAGNAAASAGVNDAGSSALRGLVDSLPDGSLVAAARRRGMMVSMPATQAVNRSIAPNASALWKEWRDPNGVLYVLHEPTGTLQRLLPNEDKFQTFSTDEQVVANGGVMPADSLDSPRHQAGDPTLDMGNMTVSNLHHYGQVGAAMSGNTRIPPVPAANLMREMVVGVPRGQFSPSRRTAAEPLAVPRVGDAGYQGKRIHRFTLHGSDDPRVAVVEHQVQSLDVDGIKWDPRTQQIVEAKNEAQARNVKNLALNQQWEHVKRVLMQGRYFKKHAFRKSNTSAYRYVFLSSDNQWVCSVPTSDVMVKVQGDDGETFMGPEAQQYFPADTKAMAVNSIEAVVLASEEERLRYRGREMDLSSTFLIVSRSHMLILECNSPEEARFFADSWNFYLFYSKPEQAKPTPQMKAPVTWGTRGGIPW